MRAIEDLTADGMQTNPPGSIGSSGRWFSIGAEGGCDGLIPVAARDWCTVGVLSWKEKLV